MKLRSYYLLVLGMTVTLHGAYVETPEQKLTPLGDDSIVEDTLKGSHEYYARTLPMRPHMSNPLPDAQSGENLPHLASDDGGNSGAYLGRGALRSSSTLPVDARGIDNVTVELGQQGFVLVVDQLAARSSVSTPEEFVKEVRNAIATLLKTELPENGEERAQAITRLRETLKGLRDKIQEQEEMLTLKDKKSLEDAITKAFDKVNKLSYAKKPKSPSPVSQPQATVTLPARFKVASFPKQTSLPHEGLPLKEYVSNLLTSFADEISPLRGQLEVSDGRLRDLLENAREDSAVKKLFYALPREKEVHATNWTNNSTIALSPKMIAKCITMLMVDPKLLIEMPNELLKEWHSAYMQKPMKMHPLKSFSAFVESAKSFLALVTESAQEDRQATVDLFLSSLALQAKAGDPAKVIGDYAQEMGIEFKATYYTQNDFELLKKRYTERTFTRETIKKELEAISFYIFKSSKNPNADGIFFDPFASTTFEGKVFTACQENTMRSLFSQILFNPKTRRLDLSLLPQHIQDAMPQDVQEFVKTYGDVDKKFDASPEGKAAEEAYNEAANQAFLKLVENKAGINYIQYKDGIRYELAATVSDTVNLLNLLFGIKGDSLKNIISTLSPDKRVTIEPSGNDFIVTLQVPDVPFKVAATYSWGKKHASVDFPVEGLVINDALVQNLYYAGEALGQFALGAYDIKLPKMLWHLINVGILKTKADFLEFFKKYSSGFDQSIPAVFYGEGWGTVFGAKFPESVRMAVVEAALEVGFDKSTHSGLLLEAFKSALNSDDMVLVSKLFKLGAKPSLELLEAVLNLGGRNKKQIVEMLFKAGLDKQEALTFALEKNSKELSIVISAGSIDVNIPDDKGMTPLMRAVMGGKSVVFDALIKAGAKLDVQNEQGESVYSVITRLVQQGISFYDALSTEQQYLDKGDEGSKYSTLENILETVVAKTVNKAVVEKELKLLEAAREAFETRAS